jgi:cardiolipin synthase
MRLLLNESHVLFVEILAGASVVAALAATVHVLLKRGENRSAVGWLGLFWLGYPLIGSLIYLLVGVNVIRRGKRASGQAILSKRRRKRAVRPRVDGEFETKPESEPCMPVLKRMGDRIMGNTLSSGDQAEFLDNGTEVYPAMLEAIASARTTVALSSYIFKDDPAGRLFADALEKAHRRGVDVRVLVDAMGSSHGGRSIFRHLRRRGVNVCRFMPSLGMPFFRFANLRNHRKLLIVDGRVGFTGGMNIDIAFWPELRPPSVVPKEDTHVRIQGPVLADLTAAFEQDWQFMTGESFDPQVWSISGWDDGTMFARGIPDGPDTEQRLTRDFILSGLAVAERSVKIMTPYFSRRRISCRLWKSPYSEASSSRFSCPRPRIALS